LHIPQDAECGVDDYSYSPKLSHLPRLENQLRKKVSLCEDCTKVSSRIGFLVGLKAAANR
jgi:hypothetical protein